MFLILSSSIDLEYLKMCLCTISLSFLCKCVTFHRLKYHSKNFSFFFFGWFVDIHIMRLFVCLLFPAMNVTATGQDLWVTTVKRIFLNVLLAPASMEPPVWRESTSTSAFAGQVCSSSTPDPVYCTSTLLLQHLYKPTHHHNFS